MKADWRWQLSFLVVTEIKDSNVTLDVKQAMFDS